MIPRSYATGWLSTKPSLRFITLDGEARPHAIATPCRVPFTLHDKVDNELARMQKLGVVTKVKEPTDWVSPMVVVPKKSGAVRMCRFWQTQ